MSAPTGLLVFVWLGVAMFLSTTEAALLALSAGVLLLSAIVAQSRTALLSLLFVVFFTLGNASFLVLLREAAWPTSVATVLDLLLAGANRGALVIVFLALAAPLLCVQIESAYSLLARLPGFAIVADLIAGSAAQARRFEFVLEKVRVGQWGRGSVSVRNWTHKLMSIPALFVPLAVNFIIDADRRTDLIESSGQAGHRRSPGLVKVQPLADIRFGAPFAALSLLSVLYSRGLFA